MNELLTAEHDIEQYLYHHYNTTANFVIRPYEYKKYALPSDYAIQCTTRDGLFHAMETLTEKLGIPFKVYKDNAFFKCIVLKDKWDILKIAEHIQEVEL